MVEVLMVLIATSQSWLVEGFIWLNSNELEPFGSPRPGNCPLPISKFGMDMSSHALFSCATSRASWKKTEYWHIINRIQGQEIWDTCCWLMYELGKSEFEKMAMCAWAIWKERTRFIHTIKGPEYSTNIVWCLHFLDEYQNAEKKKRCKHMICVIESQRQVVN